MAEAVFAMASVQQLTLINLRGHFKANLNVGIDSENRVGKGVAHAP